MRRTEVRRGAGCTVKMLPLRCRLRRKGHRIFSSLVAPDSPASLRIAWSRLGRIHYRDIFS